jgi:hypothetical protein
MNEFPGKPSSRGFMPGMEANRMFLRRCSFFTAGVAMMAACASAQTAPAPVAYTVTATNSMLGAPQTTKTYRLGSQSLIDQFDPADPKAPHSRSLYDLATHRNLSWSWPDNSAGCGTGTFSGDWGDPFTGAGDLIGPGAKVIGADTILGMTATILEGSVSGATVRAWVDKKYGMVLKAQLGQAGSPLKTVMEVTDISLTPPPASVFAVPATCAAAAAAPLPPTEAERIAAATGDSADNFVNAIYGPGSKNSCSVLLRVVRAGAMTPIVNRLQVAIDTTYNVDNPPHYVYGMGNDGTQTFSGGGIHEITSQIRNGIVRIENPPAYFNLAVNLMKPGTGASEALIYRQCFAPTTVLLYVVKDPDNPSAGGDFLWVKSGKYAAVSR